MPREPLECHSGQLDECGHNRGVVCRACRCAELGFRRVAARLKLMSHSAQSDTADYQYYLVLQRSSSHVLITMSERATTTLHAGVSRDWDDAANDSALGRSAAPRSSPALAGRWASLMGQYG